MNGDLSSTNWIKKESTSHPGRYFYLNTKTGQKLWSLKSPDGNEPTLSMVPRDHGRFLIGLNRNSGIAKPLKTPAQNRLKNLQQVLQNERRNNETKVDQTPAQNRLKNLQKYLQIEQRSCEPKIEKSSIFDTFKKISGKLYSKFTKSSTSTTATTTTTSTPTISPVPAKRQRRKSSSKSISPPSEANESSSHIMSNLFHFSNFIVAPTNIHKSEPIETSRPEVPERSPSVKTSSPINTNFKELENKKIVLRKRKLESDAEDTKKLRKIKKTGPKVTQAKRDSPTFESYYMGEISPKDSNKERSKIADKTPQYDFSQSKVLSYHFNSSSNKPISANERLNNLRKYLNNQEIEQENKRHDVKSISLRNNMATSTNPMIAAATKALETTLNNDTTPMDWDEVEVKINVEINKLRATPEEDSSTLADYYDVVKENLLKVSSEANTNVLSIKPNNFYIVIDTNIFLRNLQFLEDLTKQKLNSKGRVILIVPYSVIQELDRLKTKRDDSVSTQAIRAIKYLNSKLEANDETVKGQSATEAMRHLINVESADDSILNCCLQIKEECSNVVLLSNDVNLRNKAIINNVKTCTQGDLVVQEFSLVP